jgi:hypothetical protein
VSLDGIIFVRRRSPDWASLACDYEAGLSIDPSRYIRVDVPGFPEDIAACIRVWNETFPVNFFRCRYLLSDISERTIRQIHNAVIISSDQISEVPTISRSGECLLFFFDDDDLFAPKTFELLANVDMSRCDIAVFPLLHIGEHIHTFVRNNQPAELLVGERRDFLFRFQTNNYGISPRISRSEHLAHLQDHVLASFYADQRNLKDTYFDILISATSKTPCSAIGLSGLLSSQQQYRAYIRRYIDSLRQLKLPAELNWLNAPVTETITLFADMQGRRFDNR